MRARATRGAATLAMASMLGLLSACGGGSPKTDAATLGTILATTSTTVAAPVPVATVAPPGVTASTLPSAASPAAPVDGGGGAAPAGPSAATGLAPPAAGTYRYDTTGSSTFALTTAPYPEVSTLVVDPPTGTRQHSRRDLRNAQGTGPVIDLSLDYRPDGVYVEALKLAIGYESLPPNGQELRLASPQLLVPTDAAPGTHMEYDLPAGGSTAHLVIDIGGHESVDVAGSSVDAVVMHAVITLPPGAGSVSGSVDLQAWLAPSVSLWVKEQLTLDAAAVGGALTAHSQYEATLQRLP